MSAVLRCHHCEDERRYSDQQLLALVQGHGMLRRSSDPAPDLLLELVRSIASQVACSRCGKKGVESREDWSDDWSDEVHCEGCQAVIPAERLEVFPATKLCLQCQSAKEAGGSSGEQEYCSRCGGIMRLTQRGGSGLAGYTMVCGDCGSKG